MGDLETIRHKRYHSVGKELPGIWKPGHIRQASLQTKANNLLVTAQWWPEGQLNRWAWSSLPVRLPWFPAAWLCEKSPSEKTPKCWRASGLKGRQRGCSVDNKQLFSMLLNVRPGTSLWNVVTSPKTRTDQALCICDKRECTGWSLKLNFSSSLLPAEQIMHTPIHLVNARFTFFPWK